MRLEALVSVVVMLLMAAVIVALERRELQVLNETGPIAESVDFGSSRIIVVDVQGAVFEVADFVDFRCETPVDIDPERCAAPGSFYYLADQDQDAQEWIKEHHTEVDKPQARNIRLVRRIWRRQIAYGPFEHSDCLLSSCTGVRLP